MEHLRLQGQDVSELGNVKGGNENQSAFTP